MDSIDGCGFVNRTPDLSHSEIIQSVVFEKKDGWKIPQAKKFLRDNDFYFDNVDSKRTQLRFRQFNPEDFHNGYYITKKIFFNEKPILLIVYRKGKKIEGSAIMVNNQNVYTPKEQFNKMVDDFMKQVFKSTENKEMLRKERERRYATIRKATKRRLKQELKKH
jgi:hypothetical protein